MGGCTVVPATHKQYLISGKESLISVSAMLRLGHLNNVWSVLVVLDPNSSLCLRTW